MSAQFQFELYRIVISESEPGLFEQNMRSISGDQDITAILTEAAQDVYDRTIIGERREEIWALRRSGDSGAMGEDGAFVLRLGRGLKSQVTSTLAPDDFHESVTELDPPPVEYVHLIFYMTRHLIAVEYLATITDSAAWRKSFEHIVAQAAETLHFSSRIELEPVPGKDRVLNLFNSFDRLVRLKVVLRLPNPELSRDARALYDEMQKGGIREYAQKMYNPRGLSKERGALPHSAAEIAEAGYKVGDVQMEGVINGKRKQKRTGKKAIRSSIEMTRQVVRGMLVTAKSKETAKCLHHILDEIERISPDPDGPGNERSDAK